MIDWCNTFYTSAGTVLVMGRMRVSDWQQTLLMGAAFLSVGLLWNISRRLDDIAGYLRKHTPL